MKKLLVSVSIALAFAASGVQAAGDAAAGKAKAAACIACHGADGNSPAPAGPAATWPKLAGQQANYLAGQMADFKSGARMDPIMMGMVAALSEQDMADLAAYFASQKQSDGTAAEDQVEAGQKMYRAGNTGTGVAACMACHGPAGMGNPAANFPRISGQHAAYIEKALKDFRAGTRTNDASKMMQGVAAKMTDAEITAVSQYVQGLR